MGFASFLHRYFRPAGADVLVLQRLAQIDLTLRHIMSNLQDVKDALAQLKTDIATEKAEVGDKVTALNNTVADLTAKLAAGTAVTPDDLADLVTQIQGIDTSVKDISEPA